MTPASNLCRWYRWQFATGVIDTGNKCAAGVVDTGGNFATGGTLTCEYLRNFMKKFEMTLMLFSGAWGKVINEKTLKQKFSWHCPFIKKRKVRTNTYLYSPLKNIIQILYFSYTNV